MAAIEGKDCSSEIGLIKRSAGHSTAVAVAEVQSRCLPLRWRRLANGT
jgi:hypothetical protein